jgi:hypothetical protein
MLDVPKTVLMHNLFTDYGLSPLQLILRAALIFGIGLLALPTVASAADNSLELLPRWKKGEKLRFELIKSRQKAQGDKVTLKSTARTDVEIEVLSASKDAFTLAWTYGETRLDDPSQAKNPLTQKMANLLNGYRIVLKLDSQAGIQGVQNWQELKQRSTKLLEALSAELQAAGLDAATVAKVQAEAQSMFSSKQQIEQLGTRDAQLFFMPLGIEFEGNKPVELDDKLPNPFGGEPFPSRVRFALTAADKGLAKITWGQTVAPEEARRIMEKTLKERAERSGKPPSDADLLQAFIIEDAAEFSVEISSGWIQTFTHKRVIKTGESSQEDAVAMTRKKQ